MSGESAAVIFALEQLGRFQERAAEEGRAAARDINRRFDRFEDVVSKRFDAVDGRIADICDFRKVEHAEFRDGIEALADRMAAKEAEERGRAQVWAGLGRAAKLAGEHGWVILALAFGGWTLADDVAPLLVSLITPAPVAAMEVMREANYVAAIPPADPLRGPMPPQ